jgi:hypothetical protein
MKKLYSIGIALVFARLLNAQINVGAIAFLGFQADAPDAFAFVTLQDFNAGDSLFFTDAGWNGSQFFANEGTMSWKADQSIPVGSVVRIQDPNNASIPNALIEGPGLTRGKMSSLTLAGDQLFAYIINSNGNQIPLAAFSTNAFISQCDASGVGNTPRSCLPSNLTLGIHAVQLNDNAPASANPDNAFFNQNSISGTPEEIAQIVNNAANWITDEEPSVAGYSLWPPWQFNVGSIGNVSIGFLIDSLEFIEGGNPQQIEISINPPLNLPKNISLRFALENGIEPNDLITTPNHIDGIIQIVLPANVSVYSFSISAVADDGSEGNESGILRITDADDGIVITADSLINFGITEDISTSFVSFSSISNEVSTLEGESINFNLTFSPITAENASVTVAFQSSNGFNENDFITNPPALTNGIVINIPAGTSTLPVSFQSVDDFEVEPTENVQMLLTELSSNLQPGVNTSIGITVADNDVPVTYQNLNINEVMVNNTVSISDEFSEYDDWIEIQNSGDASVSLSSLFITNDPLVPNKFQFSSSSLCNIAPGAFKLVWADDSIEQGPLHLNFKLNNSGGYVGLYALQAGNFGPFYALIDSVYYPAMNVDVSYAYFTDIEGNWLLLNNATPGLANELPVGQNMFNESAIRIYPNPASNQITIQCIDCSPDATLLVFNSAGQSVLNQKGSKLNALSLQTDKWSPGIYFIMLISGSTTHRQTISICK